MLTLGMVFKGTAIPIDWSLLNKRGNSNTVARTELRQKFIDCFGKIVIRGLLADREFIASEWLSRLQEHGILCCIRVRNHLLTTNARELEVDMEALFYGLKPQEERIIPGARKLIGCEVYLAVLRLGSGDLLIVATNSPLPAPLLKSMEGPPSASFYTAWTTSHRQPLESLIASKNSSISLSSFNNHNKAMAHFCHVQRNILYAH